MFLLESHFCTDRVIANLLQERSLYILIRNSVTEYVNIKNFTGCALGFDVSVSRQALSYLDENCLRMLMSQASSQPRPFIFCVPRPIFHQFLWVYICRH